MPSAVAVGMEVGINSWKRLFSGGIMNSKPLRLAAVMRGRAHGERCERSSRLRQLRSQPRGLARRHDHEHRLRESPRLRLFRGHERRRHEGREALRDACRDGAAPLGLVGRDVQVRRADQDQGAPDRFDVNSCYVHTVVFADGTTADRYAQLSKPAATAAPAAPRAARLPSGEPNITGDWAPEQSRDDGPARPQRCARAREPRRGVRAGRCADAAGRRRRRRAADARASTYTDGGQARPRTRSAAARPTTRACAARRRASCSTGRSTAPSIASRRAATRSRCSTASSASRARST